MQELPDHARASLVELQRERAQELQTVTHQEQVKETADVEIFRARHRITQIDEIMNNFRMLYTSGGDPTAQVEPELKPGGPCPLSNHELLAIEGSYPPALVALARATPGQHLHGRTAARWLMDAEVLTGNLDASRTKIAKYMQRSSQWEQTAPGWYRLLDPDPASWFPSTPAEERLAPDGEETVVGDQESGTSAHC